MRAADRAGRAHPGRGARRSCAAARLAPGLVRPPD